ncbi:MAG: glycosyl transferase, partial [Deltaproteobacteria bacterium]|nr:glycosyl transferase [Deltaproteobacteria bacterium]
MSIGTLIGYFAKYDEAHKALQQLAKQNFRRTALVHKGANGDVHITDPFYRLRIYGVTLAVILFGGIAAVASLVLQRSGLLPGGNPFTLILFPAAVTIGVLAALLGIKRSRHGVESRIIHDHARWLVSGESVLILQAPVELLPRPLALLRESGDIPPALFIMHRKCERRVEMRGHKAPLSPAQVIEHAQRHAREQQMDLKPHRGCELLKRLKQSRQWVRQVCTDLAAASRLEQKATPVADWILDNEYILEGNTRDVIRNLPRRFYQQLPTLASDPYRGLPCVYGLAKDLVSHTELRLDRENILAFIEAYQSVRTLTIGELWATPQMLRIALIESIQNLAVTALTNLRERQLADFWANRLIAANRRDANQLFAILEEIATTELHPSPYFATQLVSLLYDEATALAPIKNWLERTLKTPLHDLNLREQNRQAREQLASGNAFTSLRQLALLDWREIFEQLSKVEQVLRHDPSGIYAQMDFATRDRCRRAIEDLARAAGQPEKQIAECVIMLTTQAGHEATDDEQRNYVGTWLVGKGRAELSRLLACREKLRYRLLEWIYRHHTAIYASGIGGFSALFIFLFIVFGLMPGFVAVGPSRAIRIGLVLLLLIPVSQLAIEVVNYLITRFLPPRTLPKMDFEKSGIPDAFRTLVVVPMMLVNAETIRDEVEKLEIRYLANKEANLFFSLFSDYTDSTTFSREDDKGLLAI